MKLSVCKSWIVALHIINSQQARKKPMSIKFQAEALIGSEWKSIHTYMRYMPFYGWLEYSLFLAFPTTCEQYIIGKVCYLSS